MVVVVDNLTVVNGDCGGGMVLMAQSLSFCVGVLVAVVSLIVVCDAGCGASVVVVVAGTAVTPCSCFYGASAVLLETGKQTFDSFLSNPPPPPPPPTPLWACSLSKAASAVPVNVTR